MADPTSENSKPNDLLPHVLVVDDDPLIRDELQVLFGAEGYAVQCAGSVIGTALTACANRTPSSARRSITGVSARS